MKYIIAIIIIIAVVWGGYALMNKEEAAPEATGNPAAGIEETQIPQTDTTPPKTVEVLVTARNYSFSTSTIMVKEGDTVKITLQDQVGNHDWVIDEFSARTGILKAGESQTVEFVANKTGSFEYYCSVGTHRAMGMKGTLIVE